MNPEFTEEQPTSNEGGLAFPSSGIVDLGERVKAFLDETKKTVEQPASQAGDEVPSGDQIVADMKTFIADNFDELSRSDEPSITTAAITDDFQQKGSELLTEAEQKVGRAVDSAAEKLDQMRKVIEPEKEAIEEADRIIEQADQKLEEVVRDAMHRAEDAVEHISGRLQDKEDAGMDTVEDENKRVEQAVEVIEEEMAKEAETVREITEELAEKLNQVRDEAQSVLKEVEELNSQPEETAEKKIESVVESMQDSIPTDPLPTETVEQVKNVAEEALAQIQDPESKRLIDLVNEDTEATIQKFAQGESQNLNEALFERKNSDDEDSFTKIEKEIEEKMKVHEATPAVVDNKPSEQAAEGPNEITHNIEVFEGEDPNKFEERKSETAEFAFGASIGSAVEKLPEEMQQQQFIPPTESMIEAKNEAEETIAQVINASALESAVGDAQQEAVNDDMQQQMQKPAGERIDSFEINENRGVKELIEDIQQNPPAEDRQNPPENIDNPPEMSLDDENLDSVAELSEYSKLKFVEGREGVEPKRAESFGSIDSIETRQQFKIAIHNLKEGLPFGEETQQVHTDREKTPQKERAAMDSPNADLSPNAPFQKGFDELTQQHVNPSDNSVPPAPGQTSAEGSLDSSGFEKVDHDILDQYSQEFKNQLDQAAFGRLPDDPDNRTVTGPDSGTEEDVGSSFVIVQKPEEMTDKDKAQELSYAGDGLDVVIPVPVLRKEVKPAEQQKQMSDHRDNVIEKDYGHFGRESPTDETARRIVNDAVQAAREGMGDISPHGIRSVDDYFPDPHQAAQQAHDDLLDIRDDLVPHHNDFLPEPPKADVHDEVDDMLNRMRANDEAQEQYRPKDYDLDMDQPDFRSQTPEPEETTFNRQGPLTIPSQQIPEEDDLASFDQIPHSHFETEPRPPTPPKELSDEDVKPSVVDLGPPTHVHHDQPHHSILKHGHGYGEPWFDFKTVDPRS